MKAFALGTMLVLCGALAACSSSGDGDTGTGTGSGGSGSGSGGSDAGSGGDTSTSTPTSTSTSPVTTTSTTATTASGTTCSLDGFFGDAECDPCLLAQCCSEGEACVNDQANCLNADATINPDSTLGGALIACLEGSCADECGGGEVVGICDTGMAFGNQDGTENVELDTCLGDACCAEFQACTANGSDVDSCFSCFQEDPPGELCADAVACQEEACPLDICGTGIGFPDPNVNTCIADACCTEMTACIGDGSDAASQACVDCLNSESGGELCNDAIACIDQSGCLGE